MDGLPLGIQLIAPPDNDEALLHYAKTLEPTLTPPDFYTNAVAPDWLAAAKGRLSEACKL